MPSKKWPRPSASLVISILALFAAISGVATAGNKTIKIPANSVGSKQIKNGAVNNSDLAKAAVKSPNLASAAVTRDALAPDAVTADAIAPSSVGGGALIDGSVGTGDIGTQAITEPLMAPDSVTTTAVKSSSITIEKLTDSRTPRVSAVGLGRPIDFPLPGTTCSVSSPTFSTAEEEYDNSGATVPSEMHQDGASTFLATKGGRYMLNAIAQFPTGDGTYRGLLVKKILTNGQSRQIASAIAAPNVGAPTERVLTVPVQLQAGESIELSISECGATSGQRMANVAFSMEMETIGPSA